MILGGKTTFGNSKLPTQSDSQMSDSWVSDFENKEILRIPFL